MDAIFVRLVLLAIGLGFGQIGLDSVAHGEGVAIIQLGLALVLLVAGSAGFIAPLLQGTGDREVSRHV